MDQIELLFGQPVIVAAAAALQPEIIKSLALSRTIRDVCCGRDRRIATGQILANTGPDFAIVGCASLIALH